VLQEFTVSFTLALKQARVFRNILRRLAAGIEGHTDTVGTAASNKTLSGNRATSVMNALIARGIAKSRLSAKGWGQEKPVADNRTENGRAKNRRFEVVKK
jgi:outer membrane protein OmpA-like peptidoglycan-associated protein